MAKQLDHFIRLNQAARSDIQWWYEFAESWNGISMIMQAKKDNPDLWKLGVWCIHMQAVVHASMANRVGEHSYHDQGAHSRNRGSNLGQTMGRKGHPLSVR